MTRHKSRGFGYSIEGGANRAFTDQRTTSTYIFGAICPKEGKGGRLVLPRCNIDSMNLHLAEIATQVAPGAIAALQHGAFERNQDGNLRSRSSLIKFAKDTGHYRWIRRDGTRPANLSCLRTSSLSPCLQRVLSSIQRKTFGSSCATIGYQTACSNPTQILSITAAMPGTSSWISIGASCPSDCVNGRMGTDQWYLV